MTAVSQRGNDSAGMGKGRENAIVLGWSGSCSCLANIGDMCWWSSKLVLASFMFIFPFVLEVAVEIEDSGKGGSDFTSSPKKEVDERVDWRLKNRQKATSEGDHNDERMVVLGRGPVVSAEWGSCQLLVGAVLSWGRGSVVCILVNLNTRFGSNLMVRWSESFFLHSPKLIQYFYLTWAVLPFIFPTSIPNISPEAPAPKAVKISPRAMENVFKRKHRQFCRKIAISSTLPVGTDREHNPEEWPFTTCTRHEKVADNVWCISEARSLWFGWIAIDNGKLSFWGRGGGKSHKAGFNFDGLRGFVWLLEAVDGAMKNVKRSGVYGLDR